MLFKSPRRSARVLCDTHVVKMILESVQLLCMAWHFSKDVHTWDFPLYKVTHEKHICTRWVCSDVENYKWLLSHALALSQEYTQRYKKIHKSQKILKMLEKRGIPTLSILSEKNSTTKKNKFAFDDVPKTVKNMPIAIPAKYFEKCAEYDENHKLLGISTMRNYYCLKKTIMKRKMKWNKSEVAPASFEEWMKNFTSSSSNMA